MFRLKIAGFVVAAVALFGGLVSYGPGPAPVTAEPSEAPLAVSPAICTALGVAGGATGGDALFKCLSLHTLNSQQFVDQYLGDNDGVLERGDYTRWDLDRNQIHEDDGSMWIVAFVDDATAVRFTATAGGFVSPAIQNVNLGKTYDCNISNILVGGDPDCTAGIEGGEDGVVFALYKPFGADRGAVTIEVVQEALSWPIELVITGEPKTVEFLTLESELEAGTATASQPAPAPAGPDDCVLPLNAAAVLKATTLPDRAVILAIVRDSDGLAISSGWIDWLPEFGKKGSDTVGLARPLTPTIDLGSFGVAAPNIACGGKTPGEGVVTATTTRTLLGLVGFEGPTSKITDAEFTFTVKAPPSSIALTVTPAEIACDGVTSAEVAATVTNKDGQTVVNGNEVHFDVQVLGTSNPIIAKTTDGVAKSAVTPLAIDGTGVTVVVTVGDAQAAVLVPCRRGPAAPPAAGGAGAGGAAPGGILGPDTGSGGYLDGSAGAGEIPWWPVLPLLAVAALAVGARISGRTQID